MLILNYESFYSNAPPYLCSLVVKREIVVSTRSSQDRYLHYLSLDFILNGTELLCHHLSNLFSLMLSHCCAPTSFCMSTKIPILTGSSSMGGIKNYKGIALSSLLSMLFDTCIISSQFDSLLSNYLQIAYKSVSYYTGHLGYTVLTRHLLL